MTERITEIANLVRHTAVRVRRAEKEAQQLGAPDNIIERLRQKARDLDKDADELHAIAHDSGGK